MKNLKETILEKLVYHQQVDEKLVFNKHTKEKNPEGGISFDDLINTFHTYFL